MSEQEVRAGTRLGLWMRPGDELDDWPVERRWRAAGSWERRFVCCLARPSPWEGLL